MLRSFIIGLMMGTITTAIGVAIYLDYQIKRDTLITSITLERNRYKDFYERYRDKL